MSNLTERARRYYKGARRRKQWLLARARVRAAEIFGLWSNRRKVLANSVPKSGTYLISRCLDLMPGLEFAQIWMNRPAGVADLRARLEHVYPGAYIKGHVVYRPAYQSLIRELGIKVLLMVRDPRDVAVSLLHWVTYKYRRHRLHRYFSSLPDDKARLMAIIRGIAPEGVGMERGLEPIDQYVSDFLPWIEHGACLVRFERLIGPAGGGSREAQLEEIGRIANHLEIPLCEAKTAEIAAQVFYRDSDTFRKGQIGDWANHFKAEHVAAFKEVAGDLLIKMEYETDRNW